MNASELQNLVRELARLPNETEWVEFKQNKVDPEEIGQRLSALSNSAALLGKPPRLHHLGHPRRYSSNRRHQIPPASK